VSCRVTSGGRTSINGMVKVALESCLLRFPGQGLFFVFWAETNLGTQGKDAKMESAST
jgi:hypothetical protein